MRIRSAAVILAAAVAAALLSSPAAAQRRSAPVLTKASTAPAFPLAEAGALPSVMRSPEVATRLVPDAETKRECRLVIVPVRCEGLDRYDRYLAWGIGIGGALGLAYGLAYPSNSEFLSLSPVIETAIGAGTGLYGGTAVFLVRYARWGPEWPSSR